MKKFLVSFAAGIIAMFAATTDANAYEFDGIDLNAPQQQVTREISVKGYSWNQEKQCLVGNCQGTEISLSLNLYDVTESGHVGQLIVDIPMSGSDAVKNATVLFNVIYHQTSSSNGVVTYAVANDGTTMNLSKTSNGIRLTYNTPYYKASSKK